MREVQLYSRDTPYLGSHAISQVPALSLMCCTAAPLELAGPVLLYIQFTVVLLYRMQVLVLETQTSGASRSLQVLGLHSLG